MEGVGGSRFRRRRIVKAPIRKAKNISPIKATPPPTAPPTIAPTFTFLLVAVGATEVVVEAPEVEVEVTEVEVRVAIGAAEMVDLVDLGTWDDSGPTDTKISEWRPIGQRTYLHS